MLAPRPSPQAHFGSAAPVTDDDLAKFLLAWWDGRVRDCGPSFRVRACIPLLPAAVADGRTRLSALVTLALRAQNQAVIKTLSSSLNDLLVFQRAKAGQAGAQALGLWEGPTSQHAALRYLKDLACKRVAVKEHSGAVDILFNTMADKLAPEQACERAPLHMSAARWLGNNYARLTPPPPPPPRVQWEAIVLALFELSSAKAPGEGQGHKPLNYLSTLCVLPTRYAPPHTRAPLARAEQ